MKQNKLTKGIPVAIILILLVFCITGCSKSANTSGYWNDADVKKVCEALIRDCLSSDGVDQAKKDLLLTPAVFVGKFKNESSEHMDTSIITSAMEAAVADDGRMVLSADSSKKEQLLAELGFQQDNADGNTFVLAFASGANFLLTGSVTTVLDRDGNNYVRTYFVTAELIKVPDNQRVWTGKNSDVKKTFVRTESKL
uniref:Lipoprotein n=1 Tax=uncultured bacterium contig00037 TaxID=1181525 RepID=A0A806KJS8_9BACT|nr:hypothetical protein [uncultured bacterium contig00037]